MDQLSLIDPSPGRSFAMTNLGAIWPNYEAVPGIKMIIDTVIADEEELRQLHLAMPRSALIVGELTAPIDVLKERVTSSVPDEFWRQRLRDFVDLHHVRSDLERIRHALASTHGKSVDHAAPEVINTTGWRSTGPAGTR